MPAPSIQKATVQLKEALATLQEALLATVSGEEDPSIKDCECLKKHADLVLKNAHAVHLQVAGPTANDRVTHELSAIDSRAHTALRDENTYAQPRPQVRTEKAGRREYDPVYDFLILECLRVFAQKDEYVSKKQICALLKAFDPNSEDRSVGSKLNTWHEDKFDEQGKGYVSWVRPKTNNLKITGEGEVARKELFKHAKPFAQHISDLFQTTFGFPHQIEPS